MSRRQIQQVDADRIYRMLRSRPAGLRDAEVAERLREVGKNTIRKEGRLRWAATLGRQFTNFFSVLLDISAAVCFIAERVQPGEGMLLLGWALLGVSVLNALFAFVQEYRAELAMHALQKFLPPRVTVRRNGAERDILAEDLVPGDVLLLKEGDRISADARLVESTDLLVDNSPLTGESRPQPLSALGSDAALLESHNIAFAGCSVVRGSGAAVVFATGGRTEFGKIASLSREIRRPVTPLERETQRMVRILTVIAVAMGVAFFAFGVFIGRPLWVNLVFMLGIIVANVPEGLLPTFTLALSMGSLRLARKNVLVKSLPSVEALGAVHVICTDKTGTLTLNQVKITRFADPLTGDPLSPSGRQERCLELALIASDVGSKDGNFRGDPLDAALANAFRDMGTDPLEVIRGTNRHFPFDAVKRREAGVFHSAVGTIFAVKGAWESIRPLVRFAELGDGTAVPADDARKAAADGIVRRLASQGSRVIALAYNRPDAGVDSLSQDVLEQGLILTAFLCFDDPIRPEVPDAVARCHTAGIHVIMVTGDHPDTAVAVARAAGILAPDAPHSQAVMTGAELERIPERQLVERLNAGLAVFARTNPEQKLKIISALKRMEQVVGMTGDGVNDAPALKAADIGIAMGKSGTDVARESADIVLLDDNFASIVAGVEEGRAIFENIRKFTNYVLVSNGPEIIPYLLYIVLPVPLALSIIQILSIDLGTDIVPAMGLGQEPPDRDTMQRPPRHLTDRLLDWPLLAHSYLFLGLVEAAYSLFVFLVVLVQGGWQFGQELPLRDPLLQSASGAALCTIILMQIGNLIGRRSRTRSGVGPGLFTNKLIVLGVLLEIAFSWALLYIPVVQRVLGTGPVSLWVYGLAWLGAPLIYFVDYLRKKTSRPPRAT
jgi:sodium/potassium-transporting ATPase subunit alpha